MRTKESLLQFAADTVDTDTACVLESKSRSAWAHDSLAGISLGVVTHFDTFTQRGIPNVREAMYYVLGDTGNIMKGTVAAEYRDSIYEDQFFGYIAELIDVARTGATDRLAAYSINRLMRNGSLELDTEFASQSLVHVLRGDYQFPTLTIARSYQ